MPTPPTDDRPFRLWPWLLAYAAAAVWLDLGHIHKHHSCDSVVFPLASLYEWTPFFWEQDRVGLLIPLLASWVRDPFANLLVQTGIVIFVGLSTPLALARYVYPHRFAPVAVTLGNAAFLLSGPDRLHENMLVLCMYPTAILLGTAGLLVLDGRGGGWLGTAARLVGAVVLMAVAHWVYAAVGLFLAPVVIARSWLRPPERREGWIGVLFRPALDWRVWWAGVSFGVAVLAVSWLMEVVRAADPGIPVTPPTGLPREDWPGAWLMFWKKVAEYPRSGEWAVLVLGPSLVGLVAGLVVNPAEVRRAAVRAAPLLIGALVEISVLSTRAWPAMNLYHPRYLLAVLTACWVTAVLVGFVPVLAVVLRGHARAAGMAAVGLLFVTGTVRYGPPNPPAARAELEKFRDITEVVIASGCDGIGGEPMNAWPQVFHANMVLRERGSDRVVLSVACREMSMSCPWKHRWLDGGYPDGLLLATVPDQEQLAVDRAARFGLVQAGPSKHQGGAVLIPMRVRPAGD